jgi:glucokinase-like ROK family protein
MYRIGIDLGGTHIAVGIVDDLHQIVAANSMPTVAQNGAAALLDDIAECVAGALALGNLAMADCAGAGIGVPGTCDTKCHVVRYAHNIGWDGVPVAEELGRRLGLPVRFANDADCAALGEVVAGAAKGCDGALMITLGTGVGGGFVLDGHIWSGNRGLGGEFGHVCIQHDGALCSCGARGCWEAYASATALIRQAKEAAQTHPESQLNRLEKLSGRTIYAAAAAGDATAQAVTARYAAYVGAGLVNCINVLFPDVVLLGGGISGAGEALLAPVRAFVRAHTFVRDAALLPEIRTAALGSDAGIIGAAALVR